jgi:hypothetical protein
MSGVWSSGKTLATCAGVKLTGSALDGADVLGYNRPPYKLLIAPCTRSVADLGPALARDCVFESHNAQSNLFFFCARLSTGVL